MFTSSMTGFLPFLSLLIILSAGTTKALVKIPPNKTVPAVFFFGDSIIDTGMNNYIDTVVKANFPPYGRDFEGGVPTGRFGNGKVPSDFIAQELGIMETVPAYLDPQLKPEELPYGVCFASAASGYDSLTAEIFSVISIPKQLIYFKEYITKLQGVVGKDRAQFILANSLFFIVAGSDDIGLNYYLFRAREVEYSISAYTDLMADSAYHAIKELYELGARRIGVFSAPPIGCTPAQRTLHGGLNYSCASNEDRAAKLFNKKLSAEIKSFSKKRPDSRVVYMDVYTPLKSFISHPEIYGFEVVNRGCCGTGFIEVAILCTTIEPSCPDASKYAFWDSFHPSEKAHMLLVSIIMPKYINKFF